MKDIFQHRPSEPVFYMLKPAVIEALRMMLSQIEERTFQQIGDDNDLINECQRAKAALDEVNVLVLKMNILWNYAFQNKMTLGQALPLVTGHSKLPSNDDDNSGEPK